MREDGNISLEFLMTAFAWPEPGQPCSAAAGARAVATALSAAGAEVSLVNRGKARGRAPAWATLRFAGQPL